VYQPAPVHFAPVIPHVKPNPQRQYNQPFISPMRITPIPAPKRPDHYPPVVAPSAPVVSPSPPPHQQPLLKPVPIAPPRIMYAPNPSPPPFVNRASPPTAQKTEPCPFCKATGWIQNNEKCGACIGHGFIIV